MIQPNTNNLKRLPNTNTLLNERNKRDPVGCFSLAECGFVYKNCFRHTTEVFCMPKIDIFHVSMKYPRIRSPRWGFYSLRKCITFCISKSYAGCCIKLDSSTRNQTNNVDALLNRVVETTTHVGQVVPSRVMLMMMTIMTAHHPTWETRDTLADARPTTHPRISKRFNQRFMCTTFRASQKFSNKGASQPSTVLASLNQMNSWQCYARLATALLSSTFDGLWSWLLLAQCIYK